jgi:hypothetical protein
MRGVERSPHWIKFNSIPFTAQGTTGGNPAKWIASFEIHNVPGIEHLPKQVIDRRQVREICTNPDLPVLLGYVCAMAWGGQGIFKKKHATDPWGTRERLQDHLKHLREGNLTRARAYDLFLGNGRIPGLGPSFFTKLLYFFSPQPNFYIMDQWTAKSVILLTDEPIVKMSGDLPSAENSGDDYERFCRQIDTIADELDCTGEIAEERMFSAGGIGRLKPREWRSYVKQHWKAEWGARGRLAERACRSPC